MQERAASTVSLASNTVRWVIGPTGTIVTFSEDIGLPSIFDPVPCRYKFFFLLTHTFNCVCIYIYRIFLLVLDLCHYLIVSRVFIVWSFSYPPPREKCAAPNCTNSYKYRDSKSKLPLCSLHCYRAIHQKMQPLIAC